MKTTPIREQIYEFIRMYVDTPEPKKLCSSIEDLVDELAESKVKFLALPDVSQQRELLLAFAEYWNGCNNSLIEETNIDEFLKSK
jgi:hypothetical protein